MKKLPLDKCKHSLHNGCMKNWPPNRIREFRNVMGLTQTEFAMVLGVSRTYVSYLETGYRKPSETMKKLLDCLESKLGKERKGHGTRNL